MTAQRPELPGAPAADPRSADPRPTRREVWNLLGAPIDQVGSVNDPRVHDEHGVRWNEKWLYGEADGAERIVLWHRYDFRGLFRIAPDGTAAPEPLPKPE